METKKVGFLEEVNAGGQVMNSYMRMGSFIMLFVAIGYLAVSVWHFYSLQSKILSMIEAGTITSSTLAVFNTSNVLVDITVFVVLITMAFFPKLIQKYAENGMFKK